MKILFEPVEGEYVEKKSRFICRLYKVSDFEEASDFVAKQRKEFYDAKHHCYAVVLGPNADSMRCNDDGEPSGTAGRPMLEILKHENLTDICCVVTRYFGGTLLGTGGLVRAYSEALKDALNKSSFKEEINAISIDVSYDYSFDGSVSKYVHENNVLVDRIEYSDKISATLVTREDINVLKEQLVDITKGNIIIENQKSIDILVDIK